MFSTALIRIDGFMIDKSVKMELEVDAPNSCVFFETVDAGLFVRHMDCEKRGKNQARYAENNI